ncbi:MAG: ABC transporter permease, partial [Acidimicrobiales bacterium]|nr:ABC transporter permease [Acidimicrobiales bacterium]
VRAEMGLNEPLAQRYLTWLSDIVLRQDLGDNLVPPVEPVSDRLLRAFPVNIELALLALVMSLAISIPLGILSAHKEGSALDRWVTASTFGMISVPTFLAGIVLILVLASQWELFPVGQWARLREEGLAANLHHAFLPALTLAITESAVFTRLIRNDMIAVLKQDYVLAAKAKGLPARHILLRHAFRPSSFSLVTLAGVSLGRLIGGTVVVEALFSLPGMGRVIVEGALTSDFTLVQGGVLFVAVTYVVLNVLVDLLYLFLDPRVGE